MTTYTTEEIWKMDGVEQVEAVKDKTLDPEDVLDASLQRIEQLNDELNAFTVVDEEGAKESARESSKRVQEDEELGALEGIPVGIKDLIPVEGMRTTYGSKLYENHIPDQDAVVVRRIRDEGGIILGKTNAPEFGFQGITDNAVFGKTYNPWDTEKTPGGSSGGSGAALATGMVPFALGSDGGGSIRIPSSFCGLHGIKASFGRVPLYPEHRDPELPGTNAWESVEHVGPMGRTVQDTAHLLDVLAGPHHMDRHSLPDDGSDYVGAAETTDISGFDVAYSEDFGFTAVDPTVREIVSNAVTIFEDELGCTVTRADPGFPDPEEAFTATVASSTDLKELRKELHDHKSDMEPVLVDVLETEWTAMDFTEAYKTRQKVNNKMRKFMEDYDILLTPTLAVPPFDVNIPGRETIEGRDIDIFHWLKFCFTINLTGQPAATIPAGWTDDGLPIGLQIVGNHLDDETVIEASSAYQEANPWQDRYYPM